MIILMSASYEFRSENNDFLRQAAVKGAHAQIHIRITDLNSCAYACMLVRVYDPGV